MACIDDITQLIGELQAGEQCVIEYWCAAGAPPEWILYELELARKISEALAEAKKQCLLPLAKGELDQIRDDLKNGTRPIKAVGLIAENRQASKHTTPTNKM